MKVWKVTDTDSMERKVSIIIVAANSEEEIFEKFTRQKISTMVEGIRPRSDLRERGVMVVGSGAIALGDHYELLEGVDYNGTEVTIISYTTVKY